MTTRFRRPMLVLGTTILVMQAVFMPVGMVYAETKMDTEEQELVELPLMKNYLEEEEISDPRFFFTRSRMQGTAEEPLQVTFFSDQEVSEARVFLPEEAMLLKDQLPAGISVEEGTQPNEWIVQSKRAQNTFVLPLVVEQVGNYELSVEETTAHLEISEKEETSEEVPVEEIESSDEDQAGQEELKEENGIEEEQENEQPAEEVREPVSEAPQEQQKDEEETDEASHVVEPTVFDGETAEVTTMAQFREAVGNPDIGIISVQANLTEATANVLTVDRPLLIQGNGYTLTFGNNGFYFQLEEVTQASTIRLENATLTKVGATPLINATVESSKNWTVELEDITEVNANTMRLASLPEGSIHFTGGVSNFTRTTSAQTFIEAKEVLATNQAEVTISRGNATVFFSSATVSSPKIVVENGSSLIITTTVGTSLAVDFRGDSPLINVKNYSSFFVVAAGSGSSVTNTSNLALSLSGQNSSIIVNEKSKIDISVVGLKRGINMIGSNSILEINDSELAVNTDTGSGINMNGENIRVESNNGANIKVKSNSGTGMNFSGNNPIIKFTNSEVEIDTTTGPRINILGNYSSFYLNNTILEMSSITGRGIYLQGTTPQVFMDNSQLQMKDTSSSQGMILKGTDALLSLHNQSEMTIKGAGNGMAENIQIGNNNDRPKLLVTGESKLSVTTTSGTANATDTENYAIRVAGLESQITVNESSRITILIENGTKRGGLIQGDESKLILNRNSEISISTKEGNGIEQVGSDTLFELSLNSKMLIDTSIPGHVDAAGFFLGDRDETSSNGKIKLSENSLIDIHSKNASAITLLSKGSRFLIESGSKINLKTDSSNGQFATLRFRTFGDYLFQIKDSEMNIVKNGGDAPAIRMFGGNNEVALQDGAKFNIYNKGNGVPHDGNVGSGGNMGIHYTFGGGSFNISGQGTSARIISENGPAIDMGGNIGQIKTTNGGYFEASGRTATNSGGIFRAGLLDVEFDNPLFMNFRNNRSGGGNLFNVASGSSLKATNSDLAVWKNGSNLDGDPDLNFPTLDFSLSGTNFNTLGVTNQPDLLNTDNFGTTGLTAYSRLSSNNARWAIADELRVPTNADKKIHGHVSIPVGLEEKRSAWEGEATVTIEVERVDGRKIDYTAKTVGHSNEEPGISIYGEEPRAGLFEVNLEEHLQKGDKVKIKEVRLTSGELTQGYENIILTDTIEVFPIIPPPPATFSSSIIVPISKSIQGITDNLDAEVTATHNGEPLNTESVTIDADGRFTLDLSEVSLEMDDKIQVFLRDAKGSAVAAGVVNPPATNNARGNINPVTEFTFHDVTFEPATTLIVGDVGPVSPVDPLDPEIDVNPENQPKLPEDQGLLSIDFISSFTSVHKPFLLRPSATTHNRNAY
ncbi:hypothetical protein DW084_18295 [Enterococcus casseliflavus]|uniref:Uncharacterized protein n=1 Tax=Enterococcus casseliflavus TaxID=37734 RepID=A0A415EJC0_ENTCA|nr:hypothetical protein DW084_18295 [Enterococcus casseliflavus]